MADERAVIDDDSEPATKYLTVVVTAQPADAVGVIGGQVQFSFTYAAVIPALISGYQWQIEIGGVWGDLVETVGFYEGVTTQTLTVKNLDNFLALHALGLLRFRARILFAGAVPTFTSGAVLTIPVAAIYFGYWSPSQFGGALLVGQLGSGSGIFLFPPNIYGMGGTITYNWTQLTGSADWSDLGGGLLQFQDTTGVLRTETSSWKCTATNGIISVDSDPIYFTATVVVEPPTATGGVNTTTPVTGQDGEAVSIIPPTLPLINTWQKEMQINLRTLAPPVGSIDSPASHTTTASLVGTVNPGSQTAVIGLVEATVPGFQIVIVGCWYWLVP